MKKDEYALLLKNTKWKKKRKEILKRDKYQCVKCCSKNKLHVHHKRYVLNRKPWEYNNYFLEVLCSKCHEKEHEKDIKSFIISNKEYNIELSKNLQKKYSKEKSKKRYSYKKFDHSNNPERNDEMKSFELMILKMREEALLIMNSKKY